MPSWYRSKWGLKRKTFGSSKGFILSIILLILFGSVCFFRVVENNLKPAIVQIAKAKAHILATETMNKVLYEKILTDTAYEDLMMVHKDTAQRVTLMQANTIKISRILSRANLEIKEALRNLQNETFKIPLGQALNSTLLAHVGPQIKVRLMPVGSVNVEFIDSFQQAGINQTRHILHLNINTTIQMVIPLVTENIEVYSQVPIAETIIIGEVPNTYLGLETPLFSGGIMGN